MSLEDVVNLIAIRDLRAGCALRTTCKQFRDSLEWTNEIIRVNAYMVPEKYQKCDNIDRIKKYSTNKKRILRWILDNTEFTHEDLMEIINPYYDDFVVINKLFYELSHKVYHHHGRRNTHSILDKTICQLLYDRPENIDETNIWLFCNMLQGHMYLDKEKLDLDIINKSMTKLSILYPKVSVYKSLMLKSFVNI